MVFGSSQPSGMHHVHYLPIYVHDQLKVAVMKHTVLSTEYLTIEAINTHLYVAANSYVAVPHSSKA